jgi:hypothetical protein
MESRGELPPPLVVSLGKGKEKVDGDIGAVKCGCSRAITASMEADRIGLHQVMWRNALP